MKYILTSLIALSVTVISVPVHANLFSRYSVGDLAKFKKEQRRGVSDTRKRSTLHRINQLRENKKKRKHYKKDDKRSLDKRNAASDREIHPRFSSKGLSEEQIQNYMDRYEERKRLRKKYDQRQAD